MLTYNWISLHLDVNINNIILPSGRGKPRENKRVIETKDFEKLEKAQEEARAKLKSFLDRANSEGMIETITLNESGVLTLHSFLDS